jgi:hypothetical protein
MSRHRRHLPHHLAQPRDSRCALRTMLSSRKPGSTKGGSITIRSLAPGVGGASPAAVFPSRVSRGLLPLLVSRGIALARLAWGRFNRDGVLAATRSRLSGPGQNTGGLWLPTKGSTGGKADLTSFPDWIRKDGVRGWAAGNNGVPPRLVNDARLAVRSRQICFRPWCFWP